MRALTFGSRGFDAELSAFCGAAGAPARIAASVSRILSDVRRNGDAALSRCALRFDGARLSPAQFRVDPRELAAAARAMPAARRRALAAARGAIADFNRRALPAGWTGRNGHGAEVGEKFDPIGRVGLYVPGGQVPLVSTVLMTATLARIAGCPEIAAFTPGGPGGAVATDLLGALYLAGVREVYRLGGVHAVGAMAYGTATIRPVDKIFGPGNAYVCEAKRQVFGAVGVDLLPGPSEVMVIADRSARADYAAADILAQAEHGSGREKVYLVATSRPLIRAVLAQVAQQLGGLSRSAKARRVLDRGFLVVKVAGLAEAAKVANRVAPEHLELLVSAASVPGLLRSVRTAGAIMVGNETPTALGDFVAGPSHVLPTGGAGRFSGGLQVGDFLRRTSVIRYGRAAVRRAEPTVAAFAAMERLDAHGRSVAIRVGRGAGR